MNPTPLKQEQELQHAEPPIPSERYEQALAWATQLHRAQHRKGKPVPYICHLIAVSSLVWEDRGDEEQAIAALLHDAIEDCGVTDAQIAERFGDRVARIVLDCTDTSGPVQKGGTKEPWLTRKLHYIEHLQGASLDSLLVSAADKCHNARDMVLDARRDPGMWEKFNGKLEGSAWYLLRLHQTFAQKLTGSRSVELLGESVQEILHSEPYSACINDGVTPDAWAEGYVERQGDKKSA